MTPIDVAEFWRDNWVYVTSYASLPLSWYLLYLLIKRIKFTWDLRHSYRDIPSLPRHTVWGNLVNCGERLSQGDRHPDYGFVEIWEEMGQPASFVVDLAPIDKAILVICEPELAEIVVHPTPQWKWSTPKSDTFSAVVRLIGKESMVAADGDTWKVIRKRFNPGFQPKHLYSLTPWILEKVQVFVNKLDKATETGEVITLGDYAADLTTDVVTELAMETDFKAQSTPPGQGEKSFWGVLNMSRRLSELAPEVGKGLNIKKRLNLMHPILSFMYEKVLDRKLATIIRGQMEAANSGVEKTGSRSIVSLAVHGMQPSEAIVTNTVHQIKTFLFAGHDTTSSTIQWAAWEMTQNPEVGAKLRAEHERLFGSAAFSASKLLSKPGEADKLLSGQDLAYTTAFVKEILRLHPVAGTARLVPEGSNYSLPINGQMVNVDGIRVYPCHTIIHRNPKVWGPDADVFRPDRWLDEQYMNKLPTGAWRPFERGPRNCIGQELAMIESKIVICMMARAFEFEKIGWSGKNGEGMPYSRHAVTAVPNDGMRMRVYRRKEE